MKRMVWLELYDETGSSMAFLIETELTNEELAKKIHKTANKLHDEIPYWTYEDLVDRLEKEGVLRISPLNGKISSLRIRA